MYRLMETILSCFCLSRGFNREETDSDINDIYKNIVSSFIM